MNKENNTQTPRTDAEALRINNINTPNRERVDDYTDMFVFAQGLESELASSQARMKEYERTEPLKIKERNELRDMVKDLEKMLSDEQEKNYRLLRM